MTAAIRSITKSEVWELISRGDCGKLTETESAIMQRCLVSTSKLWVGFADGKLVCMWGVIAPTLLSERAYLWLHTTEAVHDHEFVFVRGSQRAVEKLRTQFVTIEGHVRVGADRSIRWLKWLGAKLGEPEGKMIPFVIGGIDG